MKEWFGKKEEMREMIGHQWFQFVIKNLGSVYFNREFVVLYRSLRYSSYCTMYVTNSTRKKRNGTKY
jgi:hypothetical protein